MYSTHNEGKSIFVDRFVRTLKNEIYKYITSVSKNVYIDKLDDKIKCSNAYHDTIKINHVDVNSSTYIDFDIENNEKGHRFEVDDHVRTSKYKNTFAKGCIPKWSEKVFMIKKVKKYCSMDVCY